VTAIAATAVGVSIYTALLQSHNWKLQQENWKQQQEAWSLQQENDHLQRLHDKLSAAPAIQLLSSSVPSNSLSRIGLFLVNHGGGAAVMKTIKIWLDGALVENMQFIAETLLGEMSETASPGELEGVTVTYTPSGYDILPRGGEQMLLEVPQEVWTLERSKILRGFFDRISIEVSYESIYGEAFTRTFTP